MWGRTAGGGRQWPQRWEWLFNNLLSLTPTGAQVWHTHTHSHGLLLLLIHSCLYCCSCIEVISKPMRQSAKWLSSHSAHAQWADISHMALKYLVNELHPILILVFSDCKKSVEWCVWVLLLLLLLLLSPRLGFFFSLIKSSPHFWALMLAFQSMLQHHHSTFNYRVHLLPAYTTLTRLKTCLSVPQL